VASITGFPDSGGKEAVPGKTALHEGNPVLGHMIADGLKYSELIYLSNHLDNMVLCYNDIKFMSLMLSIY